MSPSNISGKVRMSTPRYDAVVVGAGIVGLATARELRRAGHTVAVLEAEDRVAAQPDRAQNSNVIHSGLYYRPGSHKARPRGGRRDETVAFCRAYDLPHRVGGKFGGGHRARGAAPDGRAGRRGLANGVECHELDAAQARRYEPAVRAIAGAGGCPVPGCATSG